MMVLPLNTRATQALRLALNLAVFQAAWFACVIGAARGHAGLGVAAVAAAVALHLALSARRAGDALLVAVCVATGAVFDTAMVRADWVEYAPLGAALRWAPAWILAMWALFATTLREPLRWLHSRPIVAALLGAFGGPLSYAAAQRLGACSFPDAHAAMLALGIGWGAITPALIALAQRVDRAS